MFDLRIQQLQQWLAQQLTIVPPNLLALTGDAGFRRYFRFKVGDESMIAVDSPGDKCNNAAFIEIQNNLVHYGVKVPEILAFNTELGFFCLSDLGDTLLFDRLTSDNMQQGYQQAIALLPQIAQLNQQGLPAFDRAIYHYGIKHFY